MDFDLERMGSREFEHLVQSFALEELGNGLKIFGDGPDGGREATFSGPVSFPVGVEGGTWDGYGIVQAKHRLRPESPADNAKWLIGELKKELQKYLPSKTGVAKPRRTPEYYLIASNVRISGVQDVGGIDLVQAEIDNWKSTIGLKGIEIWHYDHIARMLQANERIRRSVNGFTVLGDVFSAIADHFGAPMGPLAAQLRVHAAQELRAKQWVRLGDSGLDDEKKLPLSEVGVDLPAVALSEEAPVLPDGAEPDDVQVKVLEHVLWHGNKVLRQTSADGVELGIVIIGGPGQGKSTLSQIICQAYRVALLDEVAGPSLGSNIDSLVAKARGSLIRMGLETPTNKRWPVYVELSKFSDALAADPDISLVKHMASGIRLNGETLKPNQLDRWLNEWPSVIVLDGLDEVAATQTRERVLSALSDFLIESRSSGRDVFLVGTTRPQGYNGEFGEFDPKQLELRPLTSAEGLAYGKRMIDARHSEDPDLREQVFERLTEASGGKHTGKLMQSPLQVTVMATLLEGLKRAPNTRHELFDSYYKAIYAREESKAGNLGRDLQRHREDVDFVHEQVALHLQVRGELDGESEALVLDDDLKRLWALRLRTSGYEEDDVMRLSVALQNAARNRIVLLVGVRAGRIGYEVRSLQEYMAARAIASGADEVVLDRLDAVAPSAYWRNTWLLATGRVFSQRKHLRDSILERLKQLDSNTFEGRFVGLGERLALDLLLDDFGISEPRIRKSLLAYALRALDRWPTPDILLLARAAREAIDGPDSDARDIATRALEEAFGSTGRRQVSAVAVLRVWQRSPGFSGALSNRLLGGATSWRPEPEEEQGREICKVSDFLKGRVDTSNLTAVQTESMRATLASLSSKDVHLGASAAELASHAKQPLLRDHPVLSGNEMFDPEVRRRFMRAVDSIKPDAGGAAIWLRMPLVVSYERDSAGQRLGATGQGWVEEK